MVNMFIGMKNNFGGSTITQQLIKNLTEYDDVTVTRENSGDFHGSRAGKEVHEG